MFSKLVFAGFTRRAIVALALLASLSGASLAQEAELNLYSARHYATDEALYAEFTRATGIRINRVEEDDAGILSRLKAEGSASPADVILLVDATRLWKGEVEGLFKPIHSKLLEKAIPEHLRARTRPEGTSWFGFSTRARVIVYDKSRVKPEEVDSYEKLALPVNKNKLCARSGSHPYNLSLFGSMVEHLGAPATEVWLKDLVGNMARSPKGGDTDQIKAVGSGECGIALANSYYVARLLRSGAQQDQALMQRVGVIFPNQASWGTHMNIAGGAVAQYAKHPANAQKFLEYLASSSAQSYFADGNNEWPVVKGVQINNPALQAMGGVNFKTDPLPASFIGMNQIKVQQMLDRVGFR